MRLLIATPLYPPEPGGPATYTKLLEQELPARNVEVTILKFSEVKHLPRLLRHLAYFRLLLKKGKGTDAIFALDSLSVGFPARIAAKVFRIPLIVRIGGINTWERATERYADAGYPHEFTDRISSMPLFLRMLFRIERAVLRSARLVVVPSIYMKDVLAGLGIPSEHIRVVYNGINPIKGLQKINPTHPLVISAGRFVALKRFEILIDAVGLLQKDLPDIELHLYGDGPSKQMLERRIHTDAIKIFPPLSREDLMAKIANASVFALPSQHETFSNLIVEAMSTGTPVVSTAVGGTPEIITSGENGLLVPPGDAPALAEALKQVLTDQALAKRLSDNASTTLNRFSTKSVIQGTLSALKEAVE